jgi:hypothetical protein
MIAEGARMPLSDLQISLGVMVTTCAATHRAVDATTFDNLRLTPMERDWLVRLQDTPGFEVTCRIQRWWRETKLSWTTSLTMAALGPERAKETMEAYLETTPCASLFFTPEALGFLDFIANTANLAGRPHALEIARFERSLLIAKEAAQQSADRRISDINLSSGARLSPHPAAAMLDFAAAPEDLLGALVEGLPLPPESTMRFHILVAPGLPHLWRPASASESRFFTRCQNESPLDYSKVLHPEDKAILREFLDTGALRVLP